MGFQHIFYSIIALRYKHFNAKLFLCLLFLRAIFKLHLILLKRYDKCTSIDTAIMDFPHVKKNELICHHIFSALFAFSFLFVVFSLCSILKNIFI